MTYLFWNRNRKNQINCVPAIRDGNGNYLKACPLFGTGTGTTKKLSRYLRWERETQKSFPALRERESKAFPWGNIQEREFPLMPRIYFFKMRKTHSFCLCSLSLFILSLIFCLGHKKPGISGTQRPSKHNTHAAWSTYHIS